VHLRPAQGNRDGSSFRCCLELPRLPSSSATWSNSVATCRCIAEPNGHATSKLGGQLSRGVVRASDAEMSELERLEGKKLFEAKPAHFPAMSRLFEASEGRQQVVVATVDLHLTDSELFRN